MLKQSRSKTGALSSSLCTPPYTGAFTSSLCLLPHTEEGRRRGVKKGGKWYCFCKADSTKVTGPSGTQVITVKAQF